MVSPDASMYRVWRIVVGEVFADRGAVESAHAEMAIRLATAVKRVARFLIRTSVGAQDGARDELPAIGQQM